MTAGIPGAELPPLDPLRDGDPQDIGTQIEAELNNPAGDADYLTLPDPRPRLLTSAIKLAKLTFSGLDRTTQVSRYTLLLGTGKISAEGYKHMVQEAIHGRARLSGSDLADIYIGKDTMHALNNTPVIPGWAKGLIMPSHWQTGIDDPLVSAGDITATAIDLVADPFFALAWTPANTAMGKALTWPMRPFVRMLSALSGPKSGSPLAYLNFVRNPEDVLTGSARPIFEDLLLGERRATVRIHDAMTELKGTAGLGDFLKRNYRSLSNQKIAAKLYGYGIKNGKLTPKGTVNLTPEEDAVFQQLASLLDKHALAELRARKHLPANARLGQAPLEDWLPKIVGRHFIPADIWQSWDARQLKGMALRLRKKGTGAFGSRNTAAGKRAIDLRLDELDALETWKDILYAGARKLDMDPMFAKHNPFDNLSPAIKSASRFQRRYVTDLMNRFQGNARGRKAIEFDLMVAEAWDKIAQTPVGKRVENLFRKMGGGRTLDGLPDFSPTAKIAGLISHNILRSTLGFRLSTAIQNMTQVTNFAVSDGMPATLKGMLRFSDRTYADLRKAQNLLGDFQRATSDELWVSRLGKGFDDVIFGPMTLTENLIRGTGYNVGLDKALRKRGFSSITQLQGNKALTEAVMHEAHLDSLNGAFLYGTLGRAPMLSNPALRVATVLTSFPQKQAEFLAREFTRDGSAFLRFVGLHGWLIEQANKQFGIAGEDFLGWGFRPMTTSFSGVPVIMSPPMKAVLATSEAFSAWAKKDPELAERKWKEAAFNIDGALAHIGRFSALGLLPVPVLFAESSKLLIERLASHRQKTGTGGFVDITTSEAFADYLAARTTTQRARADLKKAEMNAKRRVEYVMGKRTKAFIDAAMDPSQAGDKLGHAAWDLVSGISTEGAILYPSPQQIDGYISRYVAQKTVSEDVRRMMSGGFLSQVYLGAELELLEHIDAGVLPTHTPEGRGVSH